MPCTGSHNEETGLTLGRYKGSPKKVVVENFRKKEIDLKEMTLREAWFSENFKLLEKNIKITNGEK